MHFGGGVQRLRCHREADTSEPRPTTAQLTASAGWDHPGKHPGKHAGKQASVVIGYYDSAEEAALRRARALKEKGVEPPPPPPPEPPPLTAEEAIAQAEAEGLTLELSTSNSSGCMPHAFGADPSTDR